jgi:large subunit ribosomal protein L18
MALKKSDRKDRIHNRIRKKVKGTAEKPRLAVFRSNVEIYAQLIDDRSGKTLAAADSRDKEIKANKTKKSELSRLVGKAIAAKAKAAGIETVVFDRGGYLYHGRVKALAEGAREGGLKF